MNMEAPRSPRAEKMKRYAASMREKGMAPVKVWVPAEMTAWFRQIADDARFMHEGGHDPRELVGRRLPRLIAHK